MYAHLLNKQNLNLKIVYECLFDLIHVDIWGNFSITLHDVFIYFLTIVEDLSRVTWTILLKTRSMTLECIKNFIIRIKTLFNKNIKTIRSDNIMEVNFFQSHLNKCLQNIG